MVGSCVNVMSGRGLRAHIVAFACLALGSAALVGGCTAAAADTLEWALVQAYQNNPALNAQRAALRATDENVPQALSGYRPKLSVTSTDGFAYSSTLSQTINQQVFPNTVSYSNVGKDMGQRGVGATATETLFNGFQTANKTRQAESQVMGSRETLRVTEQQVLLDAATAYMNLLRDQAILDLNRRNVEVLTEQLKQTRDRFNVGEVTRTDVAQAESRLAAGRSALLGAQSNYVTSQANYRRVIGVDPGRLDPGTPVDRLSPPTLPGAVIEGQNQSPSVLASMYGVDIAELAVKISEGALYPNLSLTASASKNYAPVYNVIKQTRSRRARHADHPDLPGRRRIFRNPPIQGDGRTAASQSRRHAGSKPAPPWCRAGASWMPPRRRSRPLPRRSMRPRSHSTACAKKRASASARRSTC